MPTITDHATAAIRAYPSLYPNRITFLSTVFSKQGADLVLNLETGEFDERFGSYQRKPEFPEIEADVLNRIGRLQEQLVERWISENAEELAKDSTFDVPTRLRELAWPTIGIFQPRELLWDEMSKDVQDAFTEVLYKYERIYEDAIRFRDYAPARNGCIIQTWNLDNPNISKILHEALALLERVTGQTYEERKAEQIAHTNSIIAELKAKGGW